MAATYKYKYNLISGEYDIVADESSFHLKDAVATYNDLPITGNSENDMRFIKDTDDAYVWSIAASSGDRSNWKQIPLLGNINIDNIGDGTTYKKLTAAQQGKIHDQNTDTQLLGGALEIISGDDIHIPNDLVVDGDVKIDGGNITSDSITLRFTTTYPYAENCASVIQAEGKGNASGQIQLLTGNDATKRLQFDSDGSIYTSSGSGVGGHLSLQYSPGVGNGVYIGEWTSEGKSQDVRIYGFPNGGSLDYAKFNILGVNNDFHITTNKDGSDIVLSPKANIRFTVGGDEDDYIKFQTIDHVPEITTVGGCDLKITSDSSLIDFGNDNLKNIGIIYGIGTQTGEEAYLRVGDAATTNHSLASEDDLMVTGKLEAKGDTYIDGKAVIAGELGIKVYAQDAEPTLGANDLLALWKDTSDNNRIFLVFRRGSSDIVSVELA